jgi:hypothetical protein
MRLFAVAAAVAVAALFGGASVSYAQNINCTGTVGGGSAVTTVNGNVTVPSGAYGEPFSAPASGGPPRVRRHSTPWNPTRFGG